MKGSDNIMLMLNSLTPIKCAYSKRNKEIDRTFKNVSLENIFKNLNRHIKVKDELSPSPEYLKNINKFEINFQNSNKYIKELSDIKKSILLANKNNYIRNDLFNPYFPYSKNNKNENKEKDIFRERLEKLKILKKSSSNTDLLDYNPNYDYIKKKIYSVHIRPLPSFLTIRQNNKNNEGNVNNNIKKNKSSFINPKENIMKEYILGQKQSRNKNIILSRNKKDNINIIFNNYNKNIYNNIIFNESYSNISNSSKNQFIDSNNINFSQIYSSKNDKKLNGRSINSKNNNKNRNSSINSDCFTMDINKSTNIENITFARLDKEKFHKSNSLRNVSNKKYKLPNLKKLLNKNTSKNKSEGNNEIKHSIYFDKMSGRKDVNAEGKNNNYISYTPNYDFIRPHIHSSIFSYKKNDNNYKKYKIGKIIRSYNFSPDQYFVFEFKNKKPIKFNLNRERLKIIEKLRKNSNNII